MTKMKKIAATAAAAALAVSMIAAQATMGVFAEGTHSITVSNTNSNHTYEAYQIFTGTATAVDGVQTLTGIEWATGVDSSALLSALVEYDSVNFTSDMSASDVAGVLTDKYSDDATGIAKVIAANLSTNATATSTYVEDTAQAVFSDMTEGYYLIKDTDGSLSNKDESYTSYILTMVGTEGASVNTKSGLPTVEKKVLEDDKTITEKADEVYGDEQYNDVADYSMGETITFALKGTMPENIDDYAAYKYTFHDTLAAGFSTPVGGGITVTIDGNQIYKDYTNFFFTTTPNADGSISIDIGFKDIKSVTDIYYNPVTVTKDSVIVITYDTSLTTNATVGLDGNTNEVYLEYSNNPNWDGVADSDSDSTGKTEEDEVIVFTYALQITKIGDDDVLPGAKFVLSDGSKYAVVDSTGKVTGWVTKEASASILESDAGGVIKVIGLDDGDYTLTEVEAPEGYDLLSESITVTITATTENIQNYLEVSDYDGADDVLTGLTVSVSDADNMAALDEDYTVTLDEGTVAITVKNSKGSSLPTTGGIGTKIFYGVGGVLVAVSGVLLVTKKRAGRSEV